MSWMWKRRAEQRASPPMDVAARVTTSGSSGRQVTRESAPLSDRDTIRIWMRDLRPESRAQVFVHRPWGTVVAVAEGRDPITVIMSEGDHAWFATAPGAAEEQALTPEQVEHVILDALSASGRPAWPDWRELI